MLGAISRANPNRAASALIQLLNDKLNIDLKAGVQETVNSKSDNANADDRIISSIKNSITHHHNEMGGTLTTDAETFVNNIVSTCLFKVVEKNSLTSNRALCKALGARSHHISLACNQVQDPPGNDAIVSSL